MREVKALRHLPVLVLTLLWAAGTSLWLLFVQEQQGQLRMGFQNQLEHLSDELLRGRLEGRLGPDSLPEGVRAFALYGPKGDLINAWGEGAPAELRNALDPDRPGILSEREAGNWIGFVKVLLPLRPRLVLWGEEPRRNPGPGRRGQGFVYLSVSDAPLEGRLWAWTLGGGAGAAVWAGFIAFVGILWFRTRRFQLALTQHRELLQFAEASRTLSHELQNPLAAILLQTALLKRSAEGLPASEVLLIEEEAQRMSALVARVRDFLKDPRGQAEAVDLAEFISSLKERFADPLAVRLEGSGPYVVKFDRHRLRSVVENLIKNAFESGPYPLPELLLSRPRAGWTRIEVLDSGAGFPAGVLKQAFQPFFTTKTTGTGIGLSIAEGFVRAAGGKLKLENRSGGGARVVLDLPEAEAGL